MNTPRRVIVLLSYPIFLLACLKDYSWKRSTARRRVLSVGAALLCSVGVLVAGGHADATAAVHATYRYQSPRAPYTWTSWYQVTKNEPGLDLAVLKGAESDVQAGDVQTITVTVRDITSPTVWRAVEFHVAK